jgi:hypothetical protein
MTGRTRRKHTAAFMRRNKKAASIDGLGIDGCAVESLSAQRWTQFNEISDER